MDLALGWSGLVQPWVALDRPSVERHRVRQLRGRSGSRAFSASSSPALAALCAGAAGFGAGALAARRRQNCSPCTVVQSSPSPVTQHLSEADIERHILGQVPENARSNLETTVQCPMCGRQSSDTTLLVRSTADDRLKCECINCGFEHSLSLDQALQVRTERRSAEPASSSSSLRRPAVPSRDEVQTERRSAEPASSSSSLRRPAVPSRDEAGVRDDKRRLQERKEELRSQFEQWVSEGKLVEGQRTHGLLCPMCHGGNRKERSFSVWTESDSFSYKCWRINKCNKWGMVLRGRQGRQQEQRGGLGYSGVHPRSCGLGAPTEALSGDLLRYMIEERGIPKEVLKRNSVRQRVSRRGNADEIVFQYLAGGELVAEKVRTIDKQFWQSQGSEKCLYGVDDLAGAETVVLTEGEIDKLSVETAGVEAVASLQGGCGGGLAEGFGAAESLAEAKCIILALDGDGCGQETAWNLAKQFGYARCRLVEWPEGSKDANDVLLQQGAEALRRLIEEAPPTRPPAARSFDLGVQQLVRDRIAGTIDPELISGVRTGWQSVDRYYRPVRGEVTVVTGIPGSGKSEWLFSLALQLAENRRWRCMLYSFEADGMALTVQLLEKLHRKRYEDLDPNNVEESYQWLDEHFVRGCQGYETPTIADIVKEAAAEARSDKGLQGLIIDPYNFIDRGDQAQEQETSYISMLMADLRRFAEEYKVHVWIVAHPTKSGAWEGEERPGLYNIAGSANWYNKTDNGIVVQRRRVQLESGEIQNTSMTEIHIDKVRNKEAGTLGSVLLRFDADQRSYIDDVDDVAEGLKGEQAMNAKSANRSARAA
eukprot:TRINITY_DN753_c0_g1_i1.p1 TRINITY_DN753_c0_g1~~TRINITY_DN753_c0_g1_i1.p1  ORF type:complete len:823 (-),score=151.19 TRINITY_DN753_c0_g1_i1:132-2600(-)